MQKLIKNLNLIWNRFKGTGGQFWDEIEEQLILSDVSINTALHIITKGITFAIVSKQLKTRLLIITPYLPLNLHSI